MLAYDTAATGKTKVEIAKGPGEESGLSDANTPRMMAIEAPAPTTPASSEAINTSFRRILSSSSEMGCDRRRRARAKDITRFKKLSAARVEGEGGTSNLIKW